MDINKIKEELNKHKKAAFDSNVLIYFLNKHSHYCEIAKIVLLQAEQKKIIYYNSILIYLEVMSGFLKTQKQEELERIEMEMVEDFFEAYDDIFYLPVNKNIARQAAFLRSLNNLKTPDAILLATAIESQASLFITNDKKIKSNQIKIIYLEDY